eukprot:1181792-Prorocentrum_minimum.AAC.1
MSSFEPIPSMPRLFSPQHLLCPLVHLAQECFAPSVTSFAVSPVPKSAYSKLSPMSPFDPPISSRSPTPSCPDPLSPQHFTSPLSSTAQLCFLPEATYVTVRPVPKFTAGKLSPMSPPPSPRLLLSSSPSWPLSFLPQHLSVASSSTAHVWPSPVDTWTTVRPVPKLTTGRLSCISLLSSPRWVLSPSPSWPSLFSPQHLSEASSKMAHVWVQPVATFATVRPEPTRTVGKKSPIERGWSPRLSVSPSPSWPLSFLPQHLSVASVKIAHAYSSPFSTVVARRPEPIYTMGKLSPISPGASPRLSVSFSLHRREESEKRVRNQRP